MARVPAALKSCGAAAEESTMTWPDARSELSDAERTLLETLSGLPRLHPIVSMFAFGPTPYRQDARSWSISVRWPWIASDAASSCSTRSEQPLVFTSA